MLLDLKSIQYINTSVNTNVNIMSVKEEIRYKRPNEQKWFYYTLLLRISAFLGFFQVQGEQ